MSTRFLPRAARHLVLAAGCAFHTRCPHAQARCSSEAPALRPWGTGEVRRVACHFPL